MKAEELIIGDLVLYFGKVFSILKVDPETELSIIEDAHHFEEANINDLNTIPLTPNILEKNGWKKDDRGYSFRDIIFLNKDDFGGWVVSISDDYILTIASIHQLQHLLFGLGLNSQMEV